MLLSNGSKMRLRTKFAELGMLNYCLQAIHGAQQAGRRFHEACRPALTVSGDSDSELYLFVSW